MLQANQKELLFPLAIIRHISCELNVQKLTVGLLNRHRLHS